MKVSEQFNSFAKYAKREFKTLEITELTPRLDRDTAGFKKAIYNLLTFLSQFEQEVLELNYTDGDTRFRLYGRL